MTSPPVVMSEIDLGKLEGYETLYIRLHGVKGSPFLYGDDFATAISAEQIASLDLKGCEVFLEGCEGFMLADAFLAAGAKDVVSSDGPTYGRKYRLGSSSIIGKNYLKYRGENWPPVTALELALECVKPEHRKNWKVIHEKV